MKSSSGIGFVILFFVLCFLEYDLGKKEIVDDRNTSAVIEKTIKKPPRVFEYVGADGLKHEIVDGDTHVFNFTVNLFYGGYIGTGPAKEEVKFVDYYTYPGKNLGPGWNGLPRNAGLNIYRSKFRSAFGYEYVCFIFTRHMIDTALIDEISGKKERQVYLAHIQWQDEKSLLIELESSSKDELEQLDKDDASKEASSRLL